MEAALLEDNKEVLATLDRKNRNRGSTSAEGGKSARTSSPSLGLRSRALLEVDVEGSRRASTGFSTSYINHSPRTTAAHLTLHRHLLDTSIPPASKKTRSAATSPTDPTPRGTQFHGERHRTSSDTSSHPASFGPRAGAGSTAGSNHHVSGNPPSNSGGPVAPKRNSQGSGWAKKLVPSAMAEVVRGGDLSVFGAGDRGRNHSVGSLGTRLSKSRSPGGFLRSSSPGGKGKLAERRRSDSKTRPPNSALTSSLSRRPRAGSESSVDTQGSNGPRLKKFHQPKSGGQVVDDSSDETNSSEEDHRGRKTLEGSAELVTSEELRRGKANDKPHKSRYEAIEQNGHSVGAALERKQQQNSATATRKSPLRNLPQTQAGLPSDPEITLTSPSGERSRPSRPKCRPTTSFEQSREPSFKPGAKRPSASYISKAAGKREVAEAQINNPDAQADISDIGHAQKLAIRRTIITNPHPSRSVRQIYRGDFSKIQKEAKDPKNQNPRRLRKYLVATDLSSEAAHALEWCIGTVLRDGDTLLAVYCVDEDVGITPPEGVESEIREQAAEVAQSTATPVFGATTPLIPLASALPRLDSSTLSIPSSPMGRKPKAELERFRAVHDITERVEKLLRKTKLQVKVVIEVIHCKSPKHLITEIIDLVSPTLVVLGSRGRSALKGVILGSFSNYLVTKSSVPVMVARKKLHSKKKFKRPETQHANNLANAAVKTMIAAKID